MDRVLGVHVDSQKPTIHDSLFYSFMNHPVGCFVKKRGQIHRLLIGFGRESVVNTDIHYSKFGPCLESINMFYNKLSGDTFYLTSLFKFSINVVGMSNVSSGTLF